MPFHKSTTSSQSHTEDGEARERFYVSILFSLIHLYLHEEDIVPFCRGQDLLHLLAVHGQRLLTQHTLLGVGKEQTHAQMVRMNNSNVHNVCTEDRLL